MKRANGEGCIRQRKNGLWEGIVTTGRDPGTGKLIRKSYFGKTQAEVRKKLTALSHDLDEGTYLEPSKMTVGQWLDVWTKEYLNHVKPLTVVRYRSQVNNHLKPALGAVRLQKLNAPMIQAFYNQELRKKNGPAPKSIIHMNGVLHKALSQAVKLGFLRFNPCDACELPRTERPHIHPMEGEQISRFMEAIKGTEYEDFYLVTLFTGVRQGEALGLTWDDVDFKDGAITIRHQLQQDPFARAPAPYHLVSLKNDRTRVLEPAPFVFDVLRHVRTEQRKNRLKAGSVWCNEMNLVFTREDGSNYSSTTTYNHFKQIVKDLGLGDLRFHDLRHTYTTVSLENGDDIKTVSENLGHATVAFTLDVYGHLTRNMKKKSAERMQTFIDSIR